MDDIFYKILNFLAIMPILLLILAAHEFGHFIMARLFGVKISECSLGYGKALWKYQKNKKHPKYIIRKYPIMAHVSLDNKTYEAQSFIKKTFILLGGPAFNIIFSFIVLFGVLTFVGLPSVPPVFNAIKVGSVADKQGFEEGDRVLSMNGNKIIRYEEVLDITYPLPIKTIDLKIKRGNKIIEKSITPKKVEYIDVDGVRREHGRLGVMVNHGPYELKNVDMINGIKAKDEDHARELVLGVLNQQIILAYDSRDGQIHDYKVWIDGKLNQHLKDPDDDHYEDFYLGKIGDNFYLDLSVTESFFKALEITKKMTSDVVTIPYQLFPVDKMKVAPETKVYGDETKIRNIIYKFSFLAAILSVIIGFINIIPVPHFDGGKFFILVFELFSKESMSPKQKFYIFTFVLGTLYLSIVAENANNMPNYIDKKIVKTQKFLDNL